MLSESSDSVRITYTAFSREELIERLRGGVTSLAHDLPVRRAVLFGSWVTGRATGYSDIATGHRSRDRVPDRRGRAT